MKASRLLFSLLVAAILCSSVFAQEASTSQPQPTEQRATLKAKHDRKISKGKSASQRALKKRKKHGKAAAAEAKKAAKQPKGTSN